MSFDVNRICRICLEEGTPSNLTSLFSGDFGITPSVMLMNCSKIQVQNGDGMPPHMCDNCIYRLGVAYHFKQQCENSDLRLRQYLGLNFKPLTSYRDVMTNTEQDTAKSEEYIKKNLPVKKRIKKTINSKRKNESIQLKRGPKPKLKQPQTCFDCGKTFKCAAQLETHIRTHTGERPFACTFCSRRFTQKHNLAIHIRTHTGEKPFQCEVCSKQFSALGNFQSHKKIHIGIKDQICPVCNKAFFNPGDLSRHMTTHTGIKNHHCDICGKGFYRIRDMVSHKNKTHQINRSESIVQQSSGTLPINQSSHQNPQNISTNRKPVIPLLLATPTARRPIHGFRDDNNSSHSSVLVTHIQTNY